MPSGRRWRGDNTRYIYKQLMDFKEGRRVNASMTGMVALLNDEDMKNPVAFYESFLPSRSPSTPI